MTEMNTAAMLKELMQQKRMVESLLAINTSAGSYKSAEIEQMLKSRLDEINLAINDTRA